MADNLLIKLKKQRGEIDSQRDEVDSLHWIVTDVIQHGEDIGALKTENTLLKDENKKKDEQFQDLMKKLEEATTGMKTLTTKVEGLTMTVGELFTKVDNLTTTVRDLSTKVKGQSNKIDGLNTKIKDSLKAQGDLIKKVEEARQRWVNRCIALVNQKRGIHNPLRSVDPSNVGADVETTGEAIKKLETMRKNELDKVVFQVGVPDSLIATNNMRSTKAIVEAIIRAQL